MNSKDILNRSFKVKMRGYDQDDVRDFLTDVSDYVYALHKENKDLQQQLERAKDEITVYEDKQDALNRSIIVAQEAADRLKEEAHDEASHVLAQAKADADTLVKATEQKTTDMLRKAIDKVHLIQEETEALRQQSVTFNIELNRMLEAYQTVIGDDRWKDLLSIETIHQVDLQQTIEAVHTLADNEPLGTTDHTKDTSEDDRQLGHTQAAELPEFE